MLWYCVPCEPSLASKSIHSTLGSHPMWMPESARTTQIHNNIVYYAWVDKVGVSLYYATAVKPSCSAVCACAALLAKKPSIVTRVSSWRPLLFKEQLYRGAWTYLYYCVDRQHVQNQSVSDQQTGATSELEKEGSLLREKTQLSTTPSLTTDLWCWALTSCIVFLNAHHYY